MQRHKRKKNIRTHKNRRVRVLAVFSIVILMVFFGSLFTIVAAAMQNIPQLDEKNMAKPQRAKVFAADGTLMTMLYAEENREVIELKDVPQDLQNAVLAIEDERFYQHTGVDTQAVIRAMFVNLESGSVVEGGSTLTQQYVKNTFITDEKTFKRKINEAFLSYELEKRYSKQEILEKYLNTIYFGQGSYGVQAAAQTYFGKDAKKLTLAESAVLAGLIKSPNNYSPYNDVLKAKIRRDVVLKNMADLGYVTLKQVEDIRKTPVVVQKRKEAAVKYPYFVEHIKQSILDDPAFGATPTQRYNFLFKSGIRIYTTLLPTMQIAAEEAVTSTLNRPTDPSAALVSIEPETGYIRALVGGKDFSVNKFNLATQGKRQPGSSFKTFVLVAALERKFSPSKIYPTGPVTINLPGADWKVANYGDGPGGPPMTIQQGTMKSVNGLYARLMMDVGTKNVIKVAKRMGIKSNMPEVASIALGSVEVTPLEMASAYGTLATMGYHAEPMSIIKITDPQGKTIKDFAVKKDLAVTPIHAWAATQILSQVVCCGTGTRARIGRPQAGKTGTAQEYRDAWFVGYTPDLSTSVWVGYPGSQREMKNVHGIKVAGGTLPAQIWAKYMKEALKNVPKHEFKKPKGAQALLNPFASSDYESVPLAKYSVPSVTGMSVTSATQAMWEAGFQVTTVEEASLTIAADTVISQSPSSGESGSAGLSVTLTVSSGPPAPASFDAITTTTTTLGSIEGGNNNGDDSTTTTTGSSSSTTSTSTTTTMPKLPNKPNKP